MAQQEYSIDLKTNFPMLHSDQSRTIIGSTAGEAPSADNKPGVAYCHNVMPYRYGYKSIGYIQVIDPYEGLPTEEEFVDVRQAFGDERSRIYLAWSSTGNVYVLPLLGTVNYWVKLGATSPAVDTPLDPNEVTIGNVNGISYIFYANKGAFTYNEISQSLQPVSFNGLSITDVKGITGSYGYLVAYTETAIAWSSTLDPTDFVPSDVTGAGGGEVAELGGAIQFVVSNSLGMIVYSEANAIAANFTGNVNFPWRFKQISNSKGGISLDLTAYAANSGEQFVYTKAGLQSIGRAEAEVIIPEVTDFLAGRVFEDFNESTLEYDVTELTSDQFMKKKLKFIGSRYLVLSYGIDTFTHAIILDTALNRIGKLKVDHADVVEYINDQPEVAKETIAIVKANGQLDIVDFSTTSATSSGVLILAKLELTRTRFIKLQGVDIENVDPNDTLDVYDQVSLDGKTFTTVSGFRLYENSGVVKYTFNEEGRNHGIVIVGKFEANTVQVTYFQSSRR